MIKNKLPIAIGINKLSKSFNGKSSIIIPKSAIKRLTKAFLHTQKQEM